MLFKKNKYSETQKKKIISYKEKILINLDFYKVGSTEVQEQYTRERGKGC